MLELLLLPEVWTSFFVLTLLELVLGIDNIIFITILADRLPPELRKKAIRIGLFFAVFLRLALLSLLFWIAGLIKPLFMVGDFAVSGRDLILLAGGFFLVWKSTTEIHELLEGARSDGTVAKVRTTMTAVIAQIIVIDLVFSIDSIITAVGIADHLVVMAAAVIVAVIMMMLFASIIGGFISNHPTIKMLALAFLFVIGVVLIADGMHTHVPKEYIYVAMAFSVAVEMLNLRLRKKGKPVELHEPYGRYQQTRGHEGGQGNQGQGRRPGYRGGQGRSGRGGESRGGEHRRAGAQTSAAAVPRTEATPVAENSAANQSSGGGQESRPGGDGSDTPRHGQARPGRRYPRRSYSPRTPRPADS